MPGPRVTDFGLAKLLGDTDDSLTRSVHGLGSPCYMAPEQMGGRMTEISTATDVYGLGAVLYELLAGRPPFSGGSAMETMRRAAEEPPAPLPRVPRELRTICLKCLAKNQDDRYRSAASLAEDLERFSRGEPILAVPLAPGKRLWRWARRRPRTAALLALCLTFLIVGVAGITWQWRRTESARAAQAEALARLEWQEIGRWLDDRQTARALAYLASLIRENPDRWQAVMYAMSIIEQHCFPVQIGPDIVPPGKLKVSACLAPDGTWLAAAGEDKTVRLWDGVSGREINQLPQPSAIASLAAGGGPVALAIALEDGNLLSHATPAALPVPLGRTMAAPISALQLCADGSHLLAHSNAGVEVWSFPEGYTGPDYLRFMFINRPRIYNRTELFGNTRGTSQKRDLYLPISKKDYIDKIYAFDGKSKTAAALAQLYAPNFAPPVDGTTVNPPADGYAVRYTIDFADGPYQIADASLGSRNSAGQAQQTLAAVLSAREQVYFKARSLNAARTNFGITIRNFRDDIAAGNQVYENEAVYKATELAIRKAIGGYEIVNTVLTNVKKTNTEVAYAAIESFPRMVGLANDVTSVARGVLAAQAVLTNTVLSTKEIATQVTTYLLTLWLSIADMKLQATNHKLELGVKTRARIAEL